MKKQEIVNRLSSTLEMNKADMTSAIQALIGELATASVEDKGKLHHLVRVHERVLDPACTYPRQMLACHDILLGLGKAELTLEEVKAAIGENAETLTTRQDPYRIYAFYQKPMEDAGWITRNKVRA